MKSSLTINIAKDFIKLGSMVIERNGGVLGKCLEMFSQLMGVVRMKEFRENQRYRELRRVNLIVGEELVKKINVWMDMIEVCDENIQIRGQNVWQLATLV